MQYARLIWRRLAGNVCAAAKVRVGRKRWSRAVVYKTWGLFGDYRLAYRGAKVRADRTDP
jgi:hypothetical protein